MALPYYKRPGKVSFLDDHTEFLDMIGVVLSFDWAVAFYNQPKPLFAAPAQEDALVVEEIKQHQALQLWLRPPPSQGLTAPL